MHNNVQELAFLDLFAKGKSCLSTSIELARYISSAYENWDNYDSDKSAGVKEKDDDKNIGKRSSNNPYELYNVYN